MHGCETPFVSVVIPVFNDAERLRLCLSALAQQTYARSRFEIIVIDNGSDDLVPVKDLVAVYDNATLAVESLPGSYAARNRGLELAKGEAIAFTDADCIPDPDWLERGVARLRQDSNCGQVVGRINLFFADPQRPTAVEVYADDVQVGHPARRSLGELYRRTVRLAGGYYDVQLKQAKSLGQRQRVFVQTLLQNLVPPVFFVVNAFGDGRLKSLDQKLKVSSVMVMVRYVSAWETLRLKFGGASSRA